MFKKIVKTSLIIYIILSTVCLKINAMDNKKENLINENSINIDTLNQNDQKLKIKTDIQNKRNNLNKLFETNKETEKLNDYYDYFDKKFKKIDKICKKIVGISRMYRRKNCKKDFTKIPFLESTIIDHFEDAQTLAHEGGYDLKTEYQKLHQKEIFDIDKNISNLEIYVRKLLDTIYMIDHKYEKYLNFIENIKDKEILNLNFVRDNFNNKIISDDNIFMKCVFDIDEMINKLKKHVIKILRFIKLEEDKRQQLKEDFYEILNCHIKKTKKAPISEKIKKEIEVIKEIIYFMIKIVESKVVNTIQDRVLGLVGNEEDVMIDKFFYNF